MLLVLPLAFASCSDDTTKEPEPEPQPVEATLEVEPASLSFEAEGGDKEFTISANNAWTVEVAAGGEWLTVTLSQGEAGFKLSVEVTATENTLTEAREGKLLVKSATLEREISVSQAAAEEPDPQPDLTIPTAPNANTYVVNGEEKAFNSVAFTMIGENPSVFATPTPGVSEWMDIMSCEEYFFAGLNSLLNGVEFDLMTEQQLYTFMGTLAGAELETVAPDYLEEILAGKCLFNYDAEAAKLTMQVGMVLLDGTKMAVNIEAATEKEEVVINENVILYGEEQKPIRASFYMAEEGMTALYFTPGAIAYFEELDIVTSYLYLMVDDALCTGEDIDITTLGDSLMMMGLENQLDPDAAWAISNDDLLGATGTINVLKSDEGYYTAVIEVEVNGVAYAVYFDGACTSYDVEMPEENTENMFFLGDVKSAIEYGCVVKAGEVWTLELSLANGEFVMIWLPSSCFDGQAYGFSQSDDIKVYYSGDDRTMSKANGDSGTISVLLTKQTSRRYVVEVEFTNYDDCEFNYSGAVEVIE